MKPFHFLFAVTAVPAELSSWVRRASCHLWWGWISTRCSGCSEVDLAPPLPLKANQRSGPQIRGRPHQAEYAPVLVSSNHGTATNPRTPSLPRPPASPHKSRHYVARPSRTFVSSHYSHRRWKTLHSKARWPLSIDQSEHFDRAKNLGTLWLNFLIWCHLASVISRFSYTHSHGSAQDVWIDCGCLDVWIYCRRNPADLSQYQLDGKPIISKRYIVIIIIVKTHHHDHHNHNHHQCGLKLYPVSTETHSTAFFAISLFSTLIGDTFKAVNADLSHNIYMECILCIICSMISKDEE